MPTRNATKTILKDRQLSPKKRFGQNFLVNPQTIEAIIDRAAPDPEDTIVEFGVGLGALTIPLARRVRRVIGIEIDAGIVKLHQEEQDLPDNVTLIHQDLLKSDFSHLYDLCGCPIKIIANLPYSISNPVIFKLIAHQDIVQSAVLMLQKEVADRLQAQPRTKEYGVLSVLLATCATIAPLMKIGPGQFHPRPKVDSMVVRISFLSQTEKEKLFPPYDYKLLHSLVKGAFQQRRKTLLNALASTGILNHGKDAIAEILHTADLDAKLRPDQLTTNQYITLARAYKEHSGV